MFFFLFDCMKHFAVQMKKIYEMNQFTEGKKIKVNISSETLPN